MNRDGYGRTCATMKCDPSPGVPESNPVQVHYARPALASAILEAAILPDGSATGIDTKALAPVDEFHVRGREATLELARAVALTPSDRVLDVGCGLGGASRYLASAFGCQVVGIDLTPDYVETARLLAVRFGLDHRVRYECADALALPFICSWETTSAPWPQISCAIWKRIESP